MLTELWCCRIAAIYVSWGHFSWIWVVHLLVQLALAKQKQPKIWPSPLPNSALSSTVLMAWIIRCWVGDLQKAAALSASFSCTSSLACVRYLSYLIKTYLLDILSLLIHRQAARVFSKCSKVHKGQDCLLLGTANPGQLFWVGVTYSHGLSLWLRHFLWFTPMWSILWLEQWCRYKHLQPELQFSKWIEQLLATYLSLFHIVFHR